ncbi:Sec-independent protein translocase subunit TatA/TatB [Nodularia spumigena]|jgi:sec-independent protein translocase protein TatA|uniref:Sec-independent protein translocase subunit TatA/TatB n=1 Tax=Nodularia spumigena TaxID=70799 RepID=UPI002B2200C3|nr:twin-arginine translocase TatA/TatE family subunit [Nodularia spumigena]MEA5615390.1 twin-arginine translocase TatA/TatE family subunit [Nodularia spumigena UHCC 0040]
MNTLAFLPNIGWTEMIVVGVVMLLLFGRRLPEVGRSLGQGIVQFKRGLKDIGDDIDVQSKAESPRFESARPPVSGGVDQRVAQGVEQPRSEPSP